MEEKIEGHYKVMSAVATEFENLVKQKFSYESQLNDLRTEAVSYEDKVYEQVYNEVTEEGKKKYANSDLRDIEQKRRLNEIDGYLQIKKAIWKLEIDLSKSKADLEVAERRLKVLSKQADLLVALTNYKASENVRGQEK